MNKFIFIFLLLFPIISEAGTIRPEISDSKYVDYGSQHKCVVKLLGKLKDSDNPDVFAFGSAVIINSRWVVTAAHVTYCTEDQYILLDDKKINIEKTIPHPDFNYGDTLSMCDIALCRTTEDVNIDFYPELYSNEDELDKICSISGYGSTGTGITGAVKYDDKKRAGSNKIMEVTDHLLKCDMSRQNPTSLEFLIAHGDSGGGLFIDKKLAGINSFVASDDKPDSSFGDESCHTRVCKYKIWLEENMK
jgi:hypothetical protein